MEVAIHTKKLKLEDSDAIILFINFYKLIFLGTKFTEKVLQIRVQHSTQNPKDAKAKYAASNSQA